MANMIHEKSKFVETIYKIINSDALSQTYQLKNDLIVIPCTFDSPELCSMHISINYKVI